MLSVLGVLGAQRAQRAGKMAVGRYADDVFDYPFRLLCYYR